MSLGTFQVKAPLLSMLAASILSVRGWWFEVMCWCQDVQAMAVPLFRSLLAPLLRRMVTVPSVVGFQVSLTVSPASVFRLVVGMLKGLDPLES
jgi:hypothetical protein